jgi:acyl-CoA thioesterase FadM
VHASCDYRRPLRFEDVVEIQLLVTEKRNRSLSYQFRFNKLQDDGRPHEEVARGTLTIVCVSHSPDGAMKAVPIPAEIAHRIEVTPPDILNA